MPWFSADSSYTFSSCTDIDPVSVIVFYKPFKSSTVTHLSYASHLPTYRSTPHEEKGHQVGGILPESKRRHKGFCVTQTLRERAGTRRSG